MSATASTPPASSAPAPIPVRTYKELGTPSILRRMDRTIWIIIMLLSGLESSMKLCMLDKHTYEVLRSRDMRWVWQLFAEEHFPKMPEAPSHIAEPGILSKLCDTSCTKCGVQNAPFIPQLLQRWCGRCFKSETVINDRIKLEEVRRIVPRTPPSLTKKVFAEYSLSTHVKLGEYLWAQKANGDAEATLIWQTYNRWMHLDRKFGDQMAIWWNWKSATR